ncbi:vicilin-like antimicrobial peptides 2-2 [Phtheirospermum japonicum]|uniref:Vicilin-like antimicrobial peptides 2-2 n=1 Tax=Phtheirospermum japonicum TaxID=374723 RepID=A0A830D4K7_9LAMI|nr:vicilin-like antimicrobial peptides 2-2 [Phtheirospermum japonicum]
MRLVRGFATKFVPSPIHIGFIRMEPTSLFIPQYLDSTLILFIHSAKIGHMDKDELVEKSLKTGDIYRIEAGSVFYLINTEEGQRLNVICSIETSESLGWHTIQSFFVAGGTYPASVLAGFDHSTLSAAFNVSEAELGKMLTRQNHGPIVHLSDSHSPSVWSKFVDMDHHHKVAHMKRSVRTNNQENIEEEQPKWSIRKLLFSLFGKADSYNILDKKPDFKNDYGWSTALDGSDYAPLQHDDVGVYLVNLSAGSMMAPHMNPRATEYGVVLRGTGFIQIVYPNGSLAMKAKVKEGNVFWIPRYFPFCQIASGSGPFEFFGFTTSARDNKPQFLVGANSLLHAMRGPEFEAAFEMGKDRLKGIINAQRESVILPPAEMAARPEEEVARSGEELVAKMIMSLGNEMVMQFD